MRGFAEMFGQVTRLIFSCDRGEFVTILASHPFAVRRRTTELEPGEEESPLASVEWDFEKRPEFAQDSSKARMSSSEFG